MKDRGSNPSFATCCPRDLSLSELRVKWRESVLACGYGVKVSNGGQQVPACACLVLRDLRFRPAPAERRQVAPSTSPAHLRGWQREAGGGKEGVGEGGKKGTRTNPHLVPY